MSNGSEEKPLMLRNVFQEDVVRHPTKPNVIGIVLQNALDSEESDLDSEEDEERIASGHALVAWYPKGLEEEVEEKKLLLVDRSLLPGDVVRWSDTNKGVQKGYIREVLVIVDIKIVGTNRVLGNVDCKQMKPLQDFVPGLVIVDGSWLGVIEEVFVKLILRLKNGARCVIDGEQVNMLTDNTDQRDEESPFYCPGFYPGQHVSGSSRVFREVQWISGPRPVMSNSQRIKAVIEEVVTSGLNVNWQVCGYTGAAENTSPTPPDSLVLPENINLSRLIPLNHFKEASIQVGDKAYYILKEDDIAIHQSGRTPASGNVSLPACTPEITKSKSVVKHKKPACKDIKDPDIKDPEDSGDTKTQCLQMELDEKKIEQPKEDDAKSTVKDDEKSYKGNKDGDKDGDKDDEGQESSFSDESADDEDSDHETERGARQSSHSNAGQRRTDPRVHQVATPRGHVTRRRRHHRRKKKFHVPVNLAAGAKVCVEVATTKTIASVVWQDGRFEERIPSTELLPVLHLDELEFFPGDFVVDKQASDSNKFGVVQTSNSQERTCRVQWLNESTPGATTRETHHGADDGVSVYELADHPDYNFRPGDVIVRLEGQKDDQNNENKQQNVPPCGQVAYVDRDGEVNVVWTDGSVMPVPPDKLYVVHREDNDMSESSSGSDTEWETASDVSSDADDNQHQLDPLEDVIIRSLAALGCSRDVDREIADMSEMNQDDDGDKVDQDVTPKDCAFGDETVPHQFLRSKSSMERFTIVEEVPESHQFYGASFEMQNQRQFATHVQKELTLLRSSLPAGILVRGYENRIDLYSILIFGPPGTPYEDGLFIFDLQLPQDYPRSPPNLHYISYCSGRLNPNLYEDGKVCVSLLGTWTGRGTETWTSKSNLCQVMLSLQGLILCEEPYYNEAGYEKHKGSAEGHENSRMYNEMVLIKLVQSIHRMTENPPEAFKSEVIEHFQDNSLRLITRIETWLHKQLPPHLQEEYSLSQYETSQIPDPEFPLYPISVGFCKTLCRALRSLRKLISKKLESSDL